MRAFFSLALLGAALTGAACGDSGPSPATSVAQSPTKTATATATVTVPGVASDTPAATEEPTPSPVEDPLALPLALQPAITGLERPTFVTHAGDGSGRLFVLEKAGRILVVSDGAAGAEPFLDIADLVTDQGNEQGLLGLAFHPNFGDNGRFFVAYTAQDGGANTLAEFRVSEANPGVADRDSFRPLIQIPDSRPNHNGGMVAFGPDGYLYLSTGDGGGGGDPDRAGQDLGVLPGKILRIDVDSGDPYGIPPDNPFAQTAGARPEIWAYGLRNPWRFSFDRETGDVWIADVGQNAWEEIDFQPAESSGGENYGWSVMEASECFRPAEGCDTSGKVLPVHEYDHSSGCSITGGYVYRGGAIPGLRGYYLFVDYCEGQLFAIGEGGGGPFALSVEQGGVSSFGEDEDGEVYLAADQGGAIYRIVAAD